MSRAPRDLRRRHRGRLSPDGTWEGILALKSNARRLLRDAATLLANDSPEGAISFAVLALEEQSKWIFLLRAGVALSPAEADAALNDGSTHGPKLQRAVETLRRTLGGSEDVSAAHGHAYMLNEIKKRTIYTALDEGESWTMPSEAVTKKSASSLLHAAVISAQIQHGLMGKMEALLEALRDAAGDDERRQSIVQLALAYRQEPIREKFAKDAAEHDAWLKSIVHHFYLPMTFKPGEASQPKAGPS